MPVSRTRRRSSLTPPQPIKAGRYGVPSIPARLTFCPNVTPVSYTSSLYSPTSLDAEDAVGALMDPAETLFPPSEQPSQPTKRRQPPGKRRSQGYIPRPPNAFMLFRADFVRQKHVPGTIEANHGSLSRIIGNCWRSLPAQDKRVWEVRAKAAKEKHKQEFPDYKFKPVHTKKKKNGSSTPPVAKSGGSSSVDRVKLDVAAPAAKSKSKAEEDEARSEYLTQLLLLGHKNESLAAEMARYDEERARREALQPPSPQSEATADDVEEGWEDEEYSETTTLSGDAESGTKLKPPPSASSHSSSPTSITWGNIDALASAVATTTASYQQHHYQHQQFGNYLNQRRSSSVPPMMSMMDTSFGYYQQPFGQDGYQVPDPPNNARGTDPMASTGVSDTSGLAFPQPRFSFSQLDSFPAANAVIDSYAQHGYYGQRMSISTEHRMLLGGRRASSAQGMRRSWGTCNSINQGWGWSVQGAFWVPPTTSTAPLQTDDSPLPEVDTSLFEPGFNLNSFSMSAPAATVVTNTPPLTEATDSVVSPLDPVQQTITAPRPTYRTSVRQPTHEDIPVAQTTYDMAAHAYAGTVNQDPADVVQSSYDMANYSIDSSSYQQPPSHQNEYRETAVNVQNEYQHEVSMPPNPAASHYSVEYDSSYHLNGTMAPPNTSVVYHQEYLAGVPPPHQADHSYYGTA